MKAKTLLFAVGGTGGHLYPAIALAQKLRKKEPLLNILFAGGGLKHSGFFEKQPFIYHHVSSGILILRNPLKCFSNLMAIGKGIKESSSLIDKSSVSLVIGFGSYYSLPILIASKYKKIPYVLHEQNTVPGRVIRLFSQGAVFTGIHFPQSALHLKGESRHVGMPLREQYTNGAIGKEKAKEHFSLDSSKPVVLIFGGSQGAESINRMIAEGVSKAKAVPFQILHFTGSMKESERITGLYCKLGIPACVKEFEERMDLAWQAADCVISRAGAASIAEQIEFEVPGILIPYPHAMDNHQEINADYFVNEVKGGIKFLESQGGGQELMKSLTTIMQDQELHRLKDCIALHKKNTKVQDFADQILSLIK